MTDPVKRRHFSEREKCLILIVIFLVLLLTAGRFLIAPQFENAAALRAEHDRLCCEQNQLHALLQQEDRIKTRHESLKPERDYLNRTIPFRAELPQVLGRFEEMLQTYPVTVEALQTGELETGARCARLPLRLRLSGEEGQALRLLEQVEQFAHLLLIDRLAWSRGEEEIVSLELSCRLIFFDPDRGE